MFNIIDKVTGCIHISDNPPIPADLTRSKFLASSLGKQSKVLIANEPWKSWNLPLVRLPDKEIFSSVSFLDEKLNIVEIAYNLDPNAKTWADWSLEKEMQNKAFHDQLLEQDLGQPPYSFAWGNVVSVYSERTEASIIVVRYEARQ